MQFLILNNETNLKELEAISSNIEIEKNISFSIKIRNELIAAAALRLARRSKELMTMTLSEYEAVEELEVEGEKMYIIKVGQ